MDPDVPQERHDVARPPNRYRHGSESVLQDQVPADDPGDELTEGRVPVGVRAPGHGNEGGEFGVAERREDRSHTREDERRNDGGAGVLGGDRTGQDENASTDDRTYSQRREVYRTQHAFQGVVGGSFLLQLGYAFSPEQAASHQDLVSFGGSRAGR